MEPAMKSYVGKLKELTPRLKERDWYCKEAVSEAVKTLTSGTLSEPEKIELATEQLTSLLRKLEECKDG